MPLRGVEIPRVPFQRYVYLTDGYTPSEFYNEFISENSSDIEDYIKFVGNEEHEIGCIFDIYRYFIIETIQGREYPSLDKLHKSLRSNTWQGYPEFYIKKISPGFRNCKTFISSQSASLAKLILGINSNIKPEMIERICRDDLSIVDDYSFYLTEGHSIELYYEEHTSEVPPENEYPEWNRTKFLTSVVIDMLLFQRAILSTFNEYIGRSTYNMQGLNHLKQEYLSALEEFKALDLSHYGSVHDIIKHGQEIFRINDKRRLFLLKLDSIEGQILSAKDSEQRNRDNLIKFITRVLC